MEHILMSVTIMEHILMPMRMPFGKHIAMPLGVPIRVQIIMPIKNYIFMHLRVIWKTYSLKPVRWCVGMSDIKLCWSAYQWHNDFWYMRLCGQFHKEHLRENTYFNRPTNLWHLKDNLISRWAEKIHISTIFTCWRYLKRVHCLSENVRLVLSGLWVGTSVKRCYGNGSCDYRLSAPLPDYEWYTNVAHDAYMYDVDMRNIANTKRFRAYIRMEFYPPVCLNARWLFRPIFCLITS